MSTTRRRTWPTLRLEDLQSAYEPERGRAFHRSSCSGRAQEAVLRSEETSRPEEAEGVGQSYRRQRQG